MFSRGTTITITGATPVTVNGGECPPNSVVIGGYWEIPGQTVENRDNRPSPTLYNTWSGTFFLTTGNSGTVTVISTCLPQQHME
ncbi:hypothetical protein AB0L06_24025 [Spirillospora sp. NPDC052269]